MTYTVGCRRGIRSEEGRRGGAWMDGKWWKAVCKAQTFGKWLQNLATGHGLVIASNFQLTIKKILNQ